MIPTVAIVQVTKECISKFTATETLSYAWHTYNRPK